MRFIGLLLFSIVLILNCSSQVVVPDSIGFAMTKVEGLYQPPYNQSERIKSLDNSMDLWDLSSVDTSYMHEARFIKDTEVEIQPLVNIVQCIDNGAFMRYWYYSDSSMLFRGDVTVYGVNKDCLGGRMLTFYAQLYANSELQPLARTKVSFVDQFDYELTAHETGTPLEDMESSSVFFGEKVVDHKAQGTLITPFDTLLDCTFIREIGSITKESKGDVVHFEYRRGYWFHPTMVYPVASVAELRRPLRDTTGHYMIKTYEVLRYKEPEKKQFKVLTCSVYPNPTTGTLHHHFDHPDEVEVFDIMGREVKREINDHSITIPDYHGQRMIVLQGECNGLTVRKKIFQIPD